MKTYFLFSHLNYPDVSMPSGSKRKRGFTLKTWFKIGSCILSIIILLAVAVYTGQEPKACCLCSSFRYHAPCLVDLQTGSMMELNVYFPHETKTAELAVPQPEQGAFSLITLGSVSGYRDTANAYIEIRVPAAETERNPALCENCRNLLQRGYYGRYVLADLYDKDNVEIIPIIHNISAELRCYTIMITEDGTGMLKVAIQGNLE